jgi:hypothetical protein
MTRMNNIKVALTLCSLFVFGALCGTSLLENGSMLLFPATSDIDVRCDLLNFGFNSFRVFFIASVINTSPLDKHHNRGATLGFLLFAIGFFFMNALAMYMFVELTPGLPRSVVRDMQIKFFLADMILFLVLTAAQTVLFFLEPPTKKCSMCEQDVEAVEDEDFEKFKKLVDF